MQLPILNGIYTDQNADYRTSYPVNMIPVPKQTGISMGYLRPGYGLISYGDGPGTDRGGINWNDVCYRVMGAKLIKIASDGTYTTIGDVGSGGECSLDYSFDYLAIASGGRLYYLSEAGALTQVTDPDLGTVLDVVWVDGYFMTTDGEFLVVTDLDDPFSVNPLKYGSSEADPDPVKALLKIRNEVYAINRHTIEVFDNVGGQYFPFQRIESAQIEKGAVSQSACCVFMETIALLGSDRTTEAPSIYMCLNSQARKISTREIDQIILGYTTQELESVVFEEKVESNHAHLMCHFPDQTLVYDGNASIIMKQPVWFILRSTLSPDKSASSQYQARNHVRVYDKWIFGDPTSQRYGYLTADSSDHFAEPVRWEFATQFIYNETNGAIFHDLELISLPGRSALNDDSTIWTQYSTDGRKWSMPKSKRLGTIGNTEKRLLWLRQGYMRKSRIQRFFGTSDANLAVSRLDANIEGLNA
jgi:hypothetical protein